LASGTVVQRKKSSLRLVRAWARSLSQLPPTFARGTGGCSNSSSKKKKQVDTKAKVDTSASNFRIFDGVSMLAGSRHACGFGKASPAGGGGGDNALADDTDGTAPWYTTVGDTGKGETCLAASGKAGKDLSLEFVIA
jgi:hypothetical protein